MTWALLRQVLVSGRDVCEGRCQTTIGTCLAGRYAVVHPDAVEGVVGSQVGAPLRVIDSGHALDDRGPVTGGRKCS